MVQHLYRGFLMNASEYALAHEHWSKLWLATSQIDRDRMNWVSPWFNPAQVPRDGNPIFTAFSQSELKAIRIIQFEPTSTALEFDFWLDYFGGDPTDRDAIRELVISCALSDVASLRAFWLIKDWIAGDIELAIGQPFIRALDGSFRDAPTRNPFESDESWSHA